MRTPKPNPLRTRGDLQNAFLELEGPLLAAWDVDGARVNLADRGGHWAWYGPQAARLEAVARYLWGLVPFSAGGGKSRGWPLVLDAIAHGTDPKHPQYWGEAGQSEQRSVEMAAFGVALRLVPQLIWEPLSAEQKDRLAAWLSGMVDKNLVPSNWQFFRLLVTMGLRHVGRAPANADEQDAKAIKQIDSYYMGDGWYSDGGGGQRDYYIPMAFHYYAMTLAKLAKAGPVTARADEWRARAREFGRDFVHWFSADGAALPFGRSLAYRFAQGAYWGGCGVAGVAPFSPGELKGMLLRHYRWWWKQPFLNGDGTLSLGYTYPNHNVLEPYNASGSPYWAFKGFAALMLPETDPFWAEDEKPLPPAASERGVQEQPSFVIDRDPASGHVVALNAGQWHPGWPLRHRDAKYAKMAYSTFFGPTVGANHEWLAGAGVDGTISVMVGEVVRSDGTLWQNRGVTTNHRVRRDHVVSDWASVPGVRIRTWLVPLAGGAWHVRVHRVETDRTIQLAEGGFAAEDPSIQAKAKSGVCVKGADGGVSGIADVSGGRSADLNDVEPNSSLYHSRVKTPVLTGRIDPGTHWLATAVMGAAPGSKASWERAPKVELVAGAKVTVTWEAERVEVTLDKEPPAQTGRKS